MDVGPEAGSGPQIPAEKRCQKPGFGSAGFDIQVEPPMEQGREVSAKATAGRRIPAAAWPGRYTKMARAFY